ncbi:alkaline phosphatase family protein [Glutamicibacter sp.]|uniref:alkaline phosphatase family protein n=1 Tax=Glutamicibacter sp. TaxID=1931995 RepID=UPI0028BF1394|nr:alkaline phosphatase family protein [Glutamicibacter sp.]
MKSSSRLQTSIAASVLALAVITPAAVTAPATSNLSVHAAPKKSAADYNGLPSGSTKKKTLVIGLDGAALSQINESNTPNLSALADGGMVSSSNLYASPMAPTVSGAGWSSIATGVWPDKHQAVDNNFTNPNYEQYPDYLTRIENQKPQNSTMVIGTWGPIPDIIFKQGADLKLSGGNDAGTTAKAVDYLKNGNPDSTFIHLDEIDGAGHNSGSDSTAYTKAHATADAQVGQILQAVHERESFAKEDWLVIVTADHGHTPNGGHGGSSPRERATFVIANGKKFPAGNERKDVKITDIAPTVLDHQSVDIDSRWSLDGLPINSIQPDDFDALRSELKSAVDETKLGTALKGWTTNIPAGWSIDNSKMPTGGVAEWSGWSFSTDEFWSNTDNNQGRETSVHNRNVFAVADSDEWDDKSHAAGQFDSTLISPKYKVNGAKKAVLTFASNYKIDGPQSAQVLVSFDGTAPVLARSYTQDFNGVENIELEIPEKAKRAQLSFHYTGTNSAFWTIDQVTLTAK